MQPHEEPRSFAPRGERREARDVVDVKPVSETKPTLRGLARGLNLSHRCNDLRFGQAASERKTIGDDVTLLKGAQANLTKLIGTKEDPVDGESLFARIKALSAQVEAATSKIKRSEVVWDRIKTSAWTAGPLLTAFGGILWWLVGARISHALGIGP